MAVSPPGLTATRSCGSRLNSLDGAAGAGKQFHSGRGKTDLPGGALEELDAQLLLQSSDRLGKVGLGHAQAFGGATEAECFRDGDEVPQLARLDVIHAC
jgi:hypothetical protein